MSHRKNSFIIFIILNICHGFQPACSGDGYGAIGKCNQLYHFRTCSIETYFSGEAPLLSNVMQIPP